MIYGNLNWSQLPLLLSNQQHDHKPEVTSIRQLRSSCQHGSLMRHDGTVVQILAKLGNNISTAVFAGTVASKTNVVTLWQECVDLPVCTRWTTRRFMTLRDSASTETRNSAICGEPTVGVFGSKQACYESAHSILE